MHTKTHWVFSPSPKLDALCAINILTGNPAYLRWYQKEHDALAPRMTPAVRDAVANLKRRIVDDRNAILSGILCHCLSITEGETLDEVRRDLKDPRLFRTQFRESPYYDAGFDLEHWDWLDELRDDLSTVLTFLERVGFEQLWTRETLPRVESRIPELRDVVSKCNVVAEVERHKGYPLPSDTVTIFVLGYAMPHGIRLTGTRFVHDVAVDPRFCLCGAVHEMTHPAFDLRDRELTDLLEAFSQDAFFMEKAVNASAGTGYEGVIGVIEEDCTQALDQLILDKCQLAPLPARMRWRDSDGGIHVFAAALYQVMQQERFGETTGTFRDFLVRVLKDGTIAPGKIGSFYQSFYAE